MRTDLNTQNSLTSSVFAGLFLVAMSATIVAFALAADRYGELPLLLAGAPLLGKALGPADSRRVG
jgi:hypothetical protein